MSAYIVIHKDTYKDVMEASNYLYECLDILYPGKVHAYHDGSFIDIDDRIHIDFRYGTDPCKFGGLLVNYYYTDNDGLIVDALEQCATKHNGKRLKNLDQIVQIVKFYMTMFDEIDAWLDKED